MLKQKWPALQCSMQASLACVPKNFFVNTANVFHISQCFPPDLKRLLWFSTKFIHGHMKFILLIKELYNVDFQYKLQNTSKDKIHKKHEVNLSYVRTKINYLCFNPFMPRYRKSHSKNRSF